MSLRILNLFRKPLAQIYEIKKIHESIKYVITLGGLLSPIGLPSAFYAVLEPNLKNDLNTFALIIILIVFIIINIFLFSFLFAKPKEEIQFGFRVAADSIINKYKYGKTLRLLGTFCALLFNASILIFILTPIIKPSDQKFTLLVANFEGPDPKKYRVSETLIEELNQFSKSISDFKVIPLDTTITTQQGNGPALELLDKHNGNLIIWGWYTALDSTAKVKCYFALKDSVKLLVGKEFTGNYMFTPSQVNSFEMQSNFSSEVKSFVSFILGLIQTHNQKYQEARNHFTSAINSSALKDSLTLSLFHYYRSYLYRSFLNQIDSAKYDLIKSIEMNQLNLGSLISLSSLYRNEGNIDSAFYYINQAIKNNPEFGLSFYARAITQLAAKDTANALNDLDTAIVKTGEYPHPFFLRGNIYLVNRKFNDAIKDFKRATLLDSSYWETYSNLSAAYREVNLDSAFHYLKKAKDLSPHSSSVNWNYALAYIYANDFENARISLLNIDKKYLDSRVLIMLGSVYSCLNRKSESLSYYKQASHKSDNLLMDFHSVSLLYFYAGRYNDALNILNSYLEVSTGRSYYFYSYRGMLHLSNKNSESALNDYLEAEKIGVANTDTLSNLHYSIAYVYFLKNDFNNSLKYLQKSLEKVVDIYSLSLYGNILFKQKKFSDALNYFERVIPKKGILINDYLSQGICYYETNKYDKAIASLNNYIKYYPDDSEPYFYLASVYHVIGDEKNKFNNIQEAYRLGNRNWNTTFFLASSLLNSIKISELREGLFLASETINTLKKQGNNSFIKDIYFIRGIFRMKLQDYSSAIDDLTLALDDRLANQYVLLYRGISYFCLQHKYLADKDFNTAFNLARTNEQRDSLNTILNEWGLRFSDK